MGRRKCGICLIWLKEEEQYKSKEAKMTICRQCAREMTKEIK